jgi:lysozyme
MSGELKILSEALVITEAKASSRLIRLGSLAIGSYFFALRNEKDLMERIVEHEGLRFEVYDDSKGIETIGIGFNLKANKRMAKTYFKQQGIDFDAVFNGTEAISEQNVIDLFTLSIKETRNIAVAYLKDFDDYPIDVQEVVLEMCFQLGNRIHKFKKTKTFLEASDYEGASEEMLDSKWAKSDTPRRARNLSKIMKKAK